ncbi:uncharacterized protein LOC140702288 [Pogona vitticeps]
MSVDPDHSFFFNLQHSIKTGEPEGPAEDRESLPEQHPSEKQQLREEHPSEKLQLHEEHPSEKLQLLMPNEVSPSWNSLMVEAPTSPRSSLGVYAESLPSNPESVHSEFEPATGAQSNLVWTPVSEVSADIELLGVKKFNLEDSLEELLQNLERLHEASAKSADSSDDLRQGNEHDSLDDILSLEDEEEA